MTMRRSGDGPRPEGARADAAGGPTRIGTTGEHDVLRLPTPWSDGGDLVTVIVEAQRGDPHAFRRLVDRHHARCLRFARNLGLSAEDAEEAVQDAFVRVWQALPRFRPELPFEPWLFRILANRCRSALGRRRWWQRGVLSDSDTVLAQMPARWGSADGDGEGLQDAVRRALEGLPAEQREAFLLRHVEGMDYADMMTVTGAGLSALKMRVKRASDALRERLQEAMA